MKTILIWSGWSDKEYPGFRCIIDEYIVYIKVVEVSEETGWNNRSWVVKKGNAIIGTGFTMGSRLAVSMCEVTLAVAGVDIFAHDSSGSEQREALKRLMDA
ncbi:MAG: hypothetical protein KDD28_18200 [Phaeodactylibacter sp.]|nr:hypothetical protein [Phaeodactylibacter sp.]